EAGNGKLVVAVLQVGRQLVEYFRFAFRVNAQPTEAFLNFGFPVRHVALLRFGRWRPRIPAIGGACRPRRALLRRSDGNSGVVVDSPFRANDPVSSYVFRGDRATGTARRRESGWSHPNEGR